MKRESRFNSRYCSHDCKWIFIDVTSNGCCSLNNDIHLKRASSGKNGGNVKFFKCTRCLKTGMKGLKINMMNL
jgi:hypothetical protein